MSEVNEKTYESKEDELIDTFRQLRKQGLTKGLTECEIAKAFKPRPWWAIFASTTFQIQILLVLLAALLAVKMGYHESVEDYVYDSPCLVDNNVFLMEVSRPLANCDRCKDLTSVPVERAISKETFVDKYAYSKIPVIIKEATVNWTAMDMFSFHFFKNLYTGTKGALRSVEENCQFFPYKTEFETLKDTFKMSDERARFDTGERPWYVGWSNCHRGMANKLRTHYERPYFLPNESESSNLDWIFMGGPGDGASIHLDSVRRPSWQAQISGAKTWTLVPSPECHSVCHDMKVTVEKGDIIVIDTNEWYHATFVHPGEVSIAIGSEYD